MGTGCKKWGRGKRAAPGGRATSALLPGGQPHRVRGTPWANLPARPLVLVPWWSVPSSGRTAVPFKWGLLAALTRQT